MTTSFSRLSSARISSTFVHITSMSADSYNVKITSGVLVTWYAAPALPPSPPARADHTHTATPPQSRSCCIWIPCGMVPASLSFVTVSFTICLLKIICRGLICTHTHAAVDENRVMIKKEYVEMIKDELQTEVCFIF